MFLNITSYVTVEYNKVDFTNNSFAKMTEGQNYFIHLQYNIHIF